MVENHGFKNVVDLFVQNIIVENKTLQLTGWFSM